MNSLKKEIKKAEKNKVAIGHFNVSEFAALRAILSAAREVQVPVIIGTSEGEAEFIGIKEAGALVGAIRSESRYPVFLNADHFKSLDKVKEAAKSGYDSVIFDAADLTLDENIEKTRKALRMAKSINKKILVEGELGYIGRSSRLLEKIPEGAAVRREDMTRPEEAKRFVKETGVDLLAPAVGEIHGMLVPHSPGEVGMKGAGNPSLDIERIRKIRKAAGVPLVLHGGSGISDDDFISAIDAGISIIHISTEIRLAWRRGLERALGEDRDRIAPYEILSDPKGKYPDPEEEIHKIVMKRLKLFNRLL
jgi:fructose-bisphosphate aldolase class II